MMSQSEYNHTIYQARKNSHLCIQCGKQDAFTLNGRARCAECTAAERERDKKRYQKSGKERNRKAYQDRLEKGVCVRCGKREPQPGRRLCLRCVRQCAERSREKRMQNSQPLQDGMCVVCKKFPALPGFKTCQTCKDRAIQNLIQGKETLARRQQEEGWSHPWRKYDDAMFGEWRRNREDREAKEAS